MEGLHEAGVPSEVIIALQGDLSQAAVSDKERALLEMAEWLTLYPADASNAVGQALEAGWTHEEVANAVFIVSYFNMVTRIADAFRLPPDDSHPFDPESKLPMLRCGQ